MIKEKEEKIFEDYLNSQNLKHSQQRGKIADIFLSVDKHLTAEELYRLVKKKDQTLGFATVYRTLKLLCEAGLCRELKFEDGTTRYEHLYGHQHHDHLICTGCGKFVEVVEPGIEHLQERIFKEYNFYPQRHRMELYGICKKCKKEGG